MNATNGSNASGLAPSASNPTVVTVLTYLDWSVRVWSLLVHVGYVLVILRHKELQSRSILFMHNANFIGLASAIMYVCWINSTSPQIADPFWFSVVCSLAEAAYAVIKYARAYSILVLGLFRYLAVFRINLYKRLSQSFLFMIGGCLAPWLTATLIFLMAKFIAHTSYAPLVCSDGFTQILSNAIIYFFLTNCFGYVAPIILVILVFLLVNKKLVESARKLNKKRLSSKSLSNRLQLQQQSSMASESFEQKIREQRDQKTKRTLAFQFFAINTLELLSAVFQASINLYLFIPTFNTQYYFMRLLVRTISNICQSLIPIFSLLFHPFKFKLHC